MACHSPVFIFYFSWILGTRNTVFLMLCVLEGSALLPDVDKGGLSCFQKVTFFFVLCVLVPLKVCVWLIVHVHLSASASACGYVQMFVYANVNECGVWVCSQKCAIMCLCVTQLILEYFFCLVFQENNIYNKII